MACHVRATAVAGSGLHWPALDDKDGCDDLRFHQFRACRQARGFVLPSWWCGFDSRRPLWLEAQVRRLLTPVAAVRRQPRAPRARLRVACRGGTQPSPRRRFGRVRRLPSCRFQVRYSLGDGRLRSAPTTFATEDEGARFPAMVETDLARGTWFDPDAGEIRLDAYAPRRLVERPIELQPRTAEIYEHLLRRHIYPTFGSTALNRITSAAVRSWNASLRESGVGPVSAAKAYRPLKGSLLPLPRTT
jgi:hypothetical protein